MQETKEAAPATSGDLNSQDDIQEFKEKLRAEMIKRRTIPKYEGENLFSVSEEDLEALQQYDEVREQMHAERVRRRIQLRLKKAKVESPNDSTPITIVERLSR